MDREDTRAAAERRLENAWIRGTLSTSLPLLVAAFAVLYFGGGEVLDRLQQLPVGLVAVPALLAVVACLLWAGRVEAWAFSEQRMQGDSAERPSLETLERRARRAILPYSLFLELPIYLMVLVSLVGNDLLLLGLATLYAFYIAFLQHPDFGAVLALAVRD